LSIITSSVPTSPAERSTSKRVIVGVDTHKDFHVAAAVDDRGALLEVHQFAATGAGYRDLRQWAENLCGDDPDTCPSSQLVYGIEGTSSYGAGLVAALRPGGSLIYEVGRPNRRDRRLRGKTDAFDAENAARAVLAGTATGNAKTADGHVEMVRVIKCAKHAAVKARAATMISLKHLIVTAPADLREQLQPLTKMALIRRCAALRPGEINDPRAATKYSLRSMARRWLNLSEEITEHEAHLDRLTVTIAPLLREGCGIGPDAAAEILTVAGDNFARITSEAALAKLCGVNPIPASSGRTNRHRLNRGGHRQANAALYRIVIVRMRLDDRTQAYVTRRTAEGKTKSEIIRCLKRHPIREIWRTTRHLREDNGPAALTA
jgi:transposase